MSNLRDEHDFQLLVVQGLRPVRGGGNYATVLRSAYESLQTQYMALYHQVSRKDIELLYGTILFSVLGQLTSGWVNRDILQILGATDPVDRLINFVSGQTMQALFDQARLQANQDHVEFVDTYLQLIRNPSQPISAFETPAKRLSYKGQLTDVIFKILHLTGYSMVVIAVDELESLNRFSQSIMRQALVSIRDFRDSFSYVGVEPGYPSIALICASTDFFFDALEHEEPALHDRWRDRTTKLHILSPADIDNLIFKLRELYYLAGYHLRPTHWALNDPEHEVIKMRKKILEDPSGTTGLTTRRIVSRLLDEIRNTWVQP
jgi:hypothetical protein